MSVLANALAAQAAGVNRERALHAIAGINRVIASEPTVLGPDGVRERAAMTRCRVPATRSSAARNSRLRARGRADPAGSPGAQRWRLQAGGRDAEVHRAGRADPDASIAIFPTASELEDTGDCLPRAVRAPSTAAAAVWVADVDEREDADRRRPGGPCPQRWRHLVFGRRPATDHRSSARHAGRRGGDRRVRPRRRDRWDVGRHRLPGPD